MALSNKMLNEQLRNKYLGLVNEFLGNCGEEVLQVKSNEIAIPVIDAEDNEKWVVLTVKVPTGADKGREPYNGYDEAEDYQHKLKEAEIKRQKKAEEKKKKIEYDKKKREEKG